MYAIEMMANMKALEEWRPELDDTIYHLQLIMDHNNLANQNVIRWFKYIPCVNYYIVYWLAKSNWKWYTLNKMMPGVVLAMRLGSLPAVWVCRATTGPFSSRPVQKLDPLTLGRPNLDTYAFTCRFRLLWLDPSVPISGSGFLVSHLWSHSDMLLLIVTYCHLYVTVYSQCIVRLKEQNERPQTLNNILKMSVNRVSTIYGLSSSVIWVVLDHKHPYRWIWQPI